MAHALTEPVSPTPEDSRVAKVASRYFSELPKCGQPLRVFACESCAGHGAPFEIPAGALPLIQQVLEEMAKGNAIALIPYQSELTTQQAADILGVSRPFLIKLLDSNALPYTRVGTHRRIPLRELIEYKRQSQQRSNKLLDELTAEAQEMGPYN